MADWVQLVPLVALVFIFWFLIMRPARKRQAAFTSLQESMAVGQRVMTTSGLFGEVVALAEETVDLQVAPGVVMTFARPAIARIEDADEPQNNDVENPDATSDG